MGEIPEDILATVVELMMDMEEEVASFGGRAALRLKVARAILAERQRCADVAKKMKEHPGGSIDWDAACEHIEDAILNP